MAEDWIKMRADLRSHPKVVRIASALKADKCPDRLRVVGALHAAWCVFDTHSVDGRLEGYTPDVLDQEVGWPGFTQALIDVEWAYEDGESLVLPRFDTHNGQSAKRRALDAQRKASVRKVSASQADKPRTRGEERRVDPPRESSTPPTRAPAPEAGASFEGHAELIGDDGTRMRLTGLTPVAEAAITLRKLGLSVTGMNPDLIAFIDEGGTLEHLLEQHAVYPDKPIKYLCTAARNELASKAAPAVATPRHAPTPSKQASAIARTRDRFMRKEDTHGEDTTARLVHDPDR